MAWTPWPKPLLCFGKILVGHYETLSLGPTLMLPAAGHETGASACRDRPHVQGVEPDACTERHMGPGA